MSQNTTQVKGTRIYAQLAAIMGEVEAVGKERRNQQQGFNFRGIEDVMNALHPIFAKHKVFILSEVAEERTEERTTAKGGTLIYRVLKVRVSFVSGEDGSRETVLVVGEGMDSGDKAANKAMSAAFKYALSQTLILPFAQVDGDADTPPDSRQTSRPQASDAVPNPNRVSAYDGSPLKPGEDPRPKDTPPQEPTGATEFHPRLYNMLALDGIAADELKAYLVRKGIITAATEIDNLPAKIVDAMLDGKDKKTGRDNWELIKDAIMQAKGVGK